MGYQPALEAGVLLAVEVGQAALQTRGLMPNLWSSVVGCPLQLCPWEVGSQNTRTTHSGLTGMAAIALLPRVDRLVLGIVSTGEVVGLIKNAS